MNIVNEATVSVVILLANLAFTTVAKAAEKTFEKPIVNKETSFRKEDIEKIYSWKHKSHKK